MFIEKGSTQKNISKNDMKIIFIKSAANNPYDKLIVNNKEYKIYAGLEVKIKKNSIYNIISEDPNSLRVFRKKNIVLGFYSLFSNITFNSIFFITITTLAPLLGGLFQSGQKNNWYQRLKKPKLNPPSWIFGVVWPILYLCMAIAVILAVNKSESEESKEKIINSYIIHIIFNAIWTPIFFGLNEIFGSLIIIILLIISILKLMYLYKKEELNQSLYFMIPYLLWCCFAFYLNFNLYLLNK